MILKPKIIGEWNGARKCTWPSKNSMIMVYYVVYQLTAQTTERILGVLSKQNVLLSRSYFAIEKTPLTSRSPQSSSVWPSSRRRAAEPLMLFWRTTCYQHWSFSSKAFPDRAPSICDLGCVSWRNSFFVVELDQWKWSIRRTNSAYAQTNK